MAYYKVNTIPEAVRNYALTFATGFAVCAYLMLTRFSPDEASVPQPSSQQRSRLKQMAKDYLPDLREQQDNFRLRLDTGVSQQQQQRITYDKGNE